MEGILALAILIGQGAIQPDKSLLEMGYRAACHAKHRGYWLSESPLSDDETYRGSPQCTTKTL